ncbi:MAG TPA: hypothetical protein VFR81_14755 [Longimicrobium sp.]|nr:hypothetical protein [Longimicrobium sp.]
MAEKADQGENADREPRGSSRKKVVGTTALLLGAAGLFMFIVGVKRRHKLDEEREVVLPPSRGGARKWTDAVARHDVEEEEAEEREEA